MRPAFWGATKSSKYPRRRYRSVPSVHRQDCLPWPSVNNPAHPRRPDKCKSCWASSRWPATPTSGTRGVQWGSHSGRLPASSPATRRSRLSTSYKTPRPMGTLRSVLRRGGWPLKSRSSAMCQSSSSPRSFVVVAGPSSSHRPGEGGRSPWLLRSRGLGRSGADRVSWNELGCPVIAPSLGSEREQLAPRQEHDRTSVASDPLVRRLLEWTASY